MDNHRPGDSILDSQEDFSPYNKFRRRQHRRVWFRREDGSEMELDTPFLFPELATAAEEAADVFEPETPSPVAATLPAIPESVVRQWGSRQQMAVHLEKLTYATLPQLGAKPQQNMTKAEKKAFTAAWERLRAKLLEARKALFSKGFIAALSGREDVPFGFVKTTYRPKKGSAITGVGSSSKLMTAERADKAIGRLHTTRQFALTQDQLDIIQRMANVESGGRIQVLNSYDGGLVSFGFLQLTLHVGKLQKLISMAPTAFARYGIALDPVKTYRFSSSEVHPAIVGVDNKDRSQLRWNGWAERFYYAGFDPDIIEAQVKYAVQYLDKQKAGLKSRLKNNHQDTGNTLYTKFINNYYNRHAYIRGLFQESFNNNPSMSTSAIAEAVRSYADSHPDPAAWLEKYKAILIRKGWSRLVEETAKGTIVTLTTPQPVPELEPEDEFETPGEFYDEPEAEVYESEYEEADDEYEDTFSDEADEEREYEDHAENEYAADEAESEENDEYEYEEDVYNETEEEEEYDELLSAGEETEYEEDEYDDETFGEDEATFYEEQETGAPGGTTAYLNVSVIKGHKRKTGAFLPDTFKPSSTVNILVYLHGLYKRGDETNGISSYWKSYANIRELFAGSGKNAIMLAPTLGSNPQSSLVLLNRKNGFDKFIDACLEALKAQQLLPQEAAPGRIIIAAHSAGGKPLSGILATTNRLSSHIDECWGFDCLYGYAYDSWLQKDRKKNVLYHYWAHNAAGQKSRPGVNGDKLQSLHPNMHNIAPKARTNHQNIIPYAWKNEIDQRPWFNGGSTSGLQQEAPATSSLKLVKLPLYQDPITIVKASKSGKLAEIKEAPAVYLKAIVRNAGEDPDKWFNSFTQVSFLGRKLKSGQYVHVSLAKLLQKTEAKFMEKYPGKSATAIGDMLGLTQEGMAASRGTSSTATYSYHMFGLALDINYNGNPYIQPGGHAAFNQFMKKVGLLNTGGLIKTVDWGAWSGLLKPADYMRLYDEFSVLDKHLERYFGYLESPDALQARLNAAQTGYWYGKTLAQATAVIKKDLKDITGAWKGTRKNPEAIFRKGGFLSLSREFMQGMVEAGFDWGGRYGDMMHFDMRTTGVGAKIESAKNAYIGKKKKEARAKFLTLV
ncbi:M15 family peptidase [Chitinophaga lutea]|uniref:M15 family peptidase n=1 Tax=Chitinophaga lutea TaxID=2488634 RepID=A0A3N4PZH9_9BACT|nr:M15 family metallopeptidase [Chitinophaga lutea]RPE14213.1 M15 family peptidase [Chitinophaga lutea]